MTSSSVPQYNDSTLTLEDLVAQLDREKRRTQDLLSSLSFALRSLNNVKQLLELVPLMACRVTDGEAGAIVLLKDDDPKGRVHQVYCPDAVFLEHIHNCLDTLPAELKSEELDQQLTECLSTRIGSAVPVQVHGAAILVKNQIRGRLFIFSRPGRILADGEKNYVWTEGRFKLLHLVADQTAVAIENDELTLKLQRKERLDRELEIGSEIQAQLLPRNSPVFTNFSLAARFQNANRVGGDYYDFIPIWGTDRWAVVIGDVMGKGVPAGLLMTMTRGMLRAEVLRQECPSLILQHLNRVMYVDLENSSRFVTLFYSELNPETSTLCYANAAHNPPLYWNAKKGELSTLDTPGMLIGLNPQSEYEQSCITLHSGDVVVYYTDGLTELSNGQDDRFGEDRLREATRWAVTHHRDPQIILDHIFGEVLAFAPKGQGINDDMTLIILQAH
jgi:sigma-B regulation protein RsbU (phosphoserine phosphatase)